MQNPRPWVKDVKVFAGLVVLNFILLCMGAVIGLVFDWGNPGRPFDASAVWFWVVATPACIAKACDREELAGWLLRLNPFIFAGTWWLVWRMFRLMRSKPRDAE